MSARGLDMEFIETDSAAVWPLQPWAVAARGAAGAEGAQGFGPADGTAEATARKQRDRGASAVEWVVITAIVVALVAGVGMMIAKAVDKKGSAACNDIANTSSGATAGTAGTTTGSGC